MLKINDELEISNKKLTVVAGPCVIESRDLIFSVAEKAKNIAEKLGINYIFKSSFRKANRSSIDSFTGPGIDEGLKLLDEVKKEFNLSILTDIHLPEEADTAAKVADILQIPAFLCRQSDIILAAAKTKKTINVKKGQFLAPEQMKHIANKIQTTGNKKVLFCERGTSFGYGDLIVDPRSFKIMSELGYEVMFDSTHSVQRPGAEGSRSGGAPEFIETLSRAAVATGYVNTVFMEIHPEPLKGLSDATNMLKINKFEALLTKLKIIHETVNKF